MEPIETLDIAKDALWVLIKISLPVMLVALIVGLIISLFQALTQIQENTLSFVPKMVAVFLCLILFLPFIFQTLQDFTEDLQPLIIAEDRMPAKAPEPAQ